MFYIMQGDAYDIPFQIITETGVATPESIDDVEIALCGICKSMKAGEVKFDESTREFLLPLKQEESFALCKGTHSAQVRCKFPNGDVIGVSVNDIVVQKSNSKGVL